MLPIPAATSLIWFLSSKLLGVWLILKLKLFFTLWFRLVGNNLVGYKTYYSWQYYYSYVNTLGKRELSILGPAKTSKSFLITDRTLHRFESFSFLNVETLLSPDSQVWENYCVLLFESGVLVSVWEVESGAIHARGRGLLSGGSQRTWQVVLRKVQTGLWESQLLRHFYNLFLLNI